MGNSQEQGANQMLWVILLIFYQSGFNSYTGTACWCLEIVSGTDTEGHSWWNDQTSTMERPPGCSQEHHRGGKWAAGQHANKCWTLFMSSFLWWGGRLALCLVPHVVQFKILLACKRWLVQSTGIPPRRERDRNRKSRHLDQNKRFHMQWPWWKPSKPPIPVSNSVYYVMINVVKMEFLQNDLYFSQGSVYQRMVRIMKISLKSCSYSQPFGHLKITHGRGT